MRKYLILLGLFAMLLISMSFIIIGPKQIDKNSLETVKKPSCSCSTPSGLSAVRVGGIVTVSWNSVPGGVTYSVGGYPSCGPPNGFGTCTPNLSAQFAYSCYVTVTVTAHCDGTSSCTNITCSSAPSQAVQSN